MRSSMLFSAALLALTTSPAFSECICRYNGGEVMHGQTACLVTAKGRELARCDKVLNISSWKFLGRPCPTASNDAPPISLPVQTADSSG
jgi:hypothetical protein